MSASHFEVKIQNALNLECWPKSKIIAIWLAGTMLCMFAATILSVFLMESLNSHYQKDACCAQSGISIFSELKVFPIGWLLHLLLPPGWGSIGVLIAVLNNHRVKLLLWSGVAALISGILWAPALYYMIGY